MPAAGYRIGLFTSPHLERIEERIAVDGQPCSAAELAEAVETVRPVVEAMDAGGAGSDPPEHGPTYFEIITAAALCHFARRRVDAAVLEVGLGGRLDSTNVCTPILSIITSISFDHTKQLGDTLAAIAAEKAGIIKPGVPVVSGVTVQRAARAWCDQSLYRTAARCWSSASISTSTIIRLCTWSETARWGNLTFIGARRRATRGGARCDRTPLRSEHVALGLLGRHQAANASLAIVAVEQLRRRGWTIPEAAVRKGLAEVAWPGRIEVVGRRPIVILDGAHNAASIAALVQTLDESFSPRRRLLVFATTQDKDTSGMLECLLGRFDLVIFTRYVTNPRGVPPEQLQSLAEQLCGARHAISACSADAWDEVRRLAKPDDLICITGSLFFAAEMGREVASRPLP